MAVCEKQGSISSGAPSPSPPLSTDQLGGPLVEPSLTTGEAIEKYQVVAQKVKPLCQVVKRHTVSCCALGKAIVQFIGL